MLSTKGTDETGHRARKKRKSNVLLNFRFSKEEPVGFEPTMADLQSTALGLLATAPCCCELMFNNRSGQPQSSDYYSRALENDSREHAGGFDDESDPR